MMQKKRVSAEAGCELQGVGAASPVRLDESLVAVTC